MDRGMMLAVCYYQLLRILRGTGKNSTVTLSTPPMQAWCLPGRVYSEPLVQVSQRYSRRTLSPNSSASAGRTGSNPDFGGYTQAAPTRRKQKNQEGPPHGPPHAAEVVVTHVSWRFESSDFTMKVGDTVVLLGLSQARLNSQLATIVRRDGADSWIVELNELHIGVRQGYTQLR
jgi:hypothetical protein